jgi:hypothetical protein
MAGDFLWRRSGLKHGVVRMGFVVGKLALGHISRRTLWFSSAVYGPTIVNEFEN